MALPSFLSRNQPRLNGSRSSAPIEKDRSGTATQRFARLIDATQGPESDFALPHVLQFSGIITGAWRTYYHGQYDEAMRFSQEDALAMRNDAWLMSLLDERKRAVATLKQHIEVDNPRDPVQKALADGLMQIYKNLPNYTDLTMSGLEAIWFGRAGDQFIYRYKDVQVPAMPRLAAAPGVPATMVASEGEYETRRVLSMIRHQPVEGDKVGYDVDGTPYFIVSPIVALNTQKDYPGADFRIFDGKKWRSDGDHPRPTNPNLNAKHASLGLTTVGGKALFLKGNWRSRARIHKHMVLDSSYWQPWKADSIHGVGIRSVIFWYWWLRQEYLANITEWASRTGLGIKLWYYEQGNAASKSAIMSAAKDSDQKVNIAVPYDPSQPNRPAVDIVEMAGTGAELLITITKHIEEYIERYVVGQNMTGGSDDFSAGFGDRGRADLASKTNWQITKLDARKFDDTNTTDILDVIKRFSYPEYAEIPARLVSEVDDPDIKKSAEGMKAFVDMGGEVVEDEARAKLGGLSKPRGSDKTIGGLKALQAKQATSGHVKPPDGMGPDGAPGVNGQAQPEESPSPLDHAADTADRLRMQGDRPESYGWITIGGHEEGDAKHVGGFHVEIDADGKVKRGGASVMHGKPIHEAVEALEKIDKKKTEEAAEKTAEPDQSANLQTETATKPARSPEEQKAFIEKNFMMAQDIADHIGGNDPMANSDAATDALQRAAKHFDETKGDLKNYLSRAIKHELRSQGRKAAREQRAIPSQSISGKEGQNIDVESPRPAVEPKGPQMAEVDEAMATLPEQTRRILEERKHGKAFPEIAELLGMQPNAVKTQASRAYKTLREMIPHSFDLIAHLFDEKWLYEYGPRHHPEASVKGAVLRLRALKEHRIDGEVLDAELDSIAREFTADELRQIAEQCEVKAASTKWETLANLREYVSGRGDKERSSEAELYNEYRKMIEDML